MNFTRPLAPAPHLSWVGFSLERHAWYVGGSWLFGLQVVLFAISRVVDAIWFPLTSQAFFAAMLLFACLVGLDALQAGMGYRRAALWATLATIGWIFGGLAYARRRSLRRCD